MAKLFAKTATVFAADSVSLFGNEVNTHTYSPVGTVVHYEYYDTFFYSRHLNWNPDQIVQTYSSMQYSSYLISTMKNNGRMNYDILNPGTTLTSNGRTRIYKKNCATLLGATLVVPHILHDTVIFAAHFFENKNMDVWYLYCYQRMVTSSFLPHSHSGGDSFERMNQSNQINLAWWCCLLFVWI